MLKNKNPAEIMCGLVADFDFSSAANIALQGGVITGALEYKNKGAFFDGTSDYITYPVRTQLFESGVFSAVIEFTPNFELNDGSIHYFFRALGASATSFYKDSDGTLKLRNGTNVSAFTLASLEPYWKTNQRNVIVVTRATTPASVVYLNGVFISTQTNPMTFGTPHTSLLIGAVETPASYFSGTIHSVKFFKHYAAGGLLTTQEALDYYTGQTFNYMKRASVILPMTAENHDATNGITKDVSGRGNDFTITGAVKLARRGYSLSGNNNFQAALELVGAGDITIGGVYNLTTFTGANYRFAENGKIIFYLASATGIINFSSNAGVSAAATTGPLMPGVHSLFATRSAAGTVAFYLDGKVIPSTTNSGATAAGTYGLKFGGTPSVIGNDYGNYLFPFLMTPLQIADLHLKLMKNINLI
jgi:hypothetical protein